MTNQQNVGSFDVKQTIRDEIAEQYLAQLPFEPYPMQEDALFA